LATFKIQRRLPGKILAARALVQGMNLDVLGLLAGLKGVTGVTRLTAGAASGLSAQAFGLGFFRPVRGWGARTIVAILGGRVPQAGILGL